MTNQNLLATNNIRLFNMPVKCPDLNPTEYLWNLMKSHVHALAQHPDLAILQRDINLVWLVLIKEVLKKAICRYNEIEVPGGYSSKQRTFVCLFHVLI